MKLGRQSLALGSSFLGKELHIDNSFYFELSRHNTSEDLRRLRGPKHIMSVVLNLEIREKPRQMGKGRK